MAWLTGYGFRKKITISTTNVDADLTSFPVYIPIVNDTDIGGEALSTGYDVRFTSSDGETELYQERLGFAVAGGSANGDFYVRVPTVDGDANTDIYCYYDKADATDVSNGQNVFQTAEGWRAVWHLEESAHPYLDATANNNDSASATTPTRVAGKIGYGQDFQGTSPGYQHIHIADSDSLDLGTGDFSISLWFNVEAVNVEQYLFDKVGTEYWYVEINNTAGTLRGAIYDGTHSRSVTSSAINASTWYHGCVTCDRDSSTGFNVYIDGAWTTASNPTNVESAITNTAEAMIGAKSTDYSKGTDGIIDEIRMWGEVKGPEWIKFEFYNSHDGHAAGNELTWAGEEAGGAAESNVLYMII